MSFPENGPMRNAMKNAEIPESSKEKLEIPTNLKKDNAHEKKKNYQFMLQPSIREKINKLAKENNYSSSSAFLNELIKKL
ncbi:CopG family transcriptional regulator [Staphylococcus agnetis]|uniref:CopG family transcriptional regulator n=1 Tax=Staphylococcus agnetis TaxID=985762 RepID=UPI00208F0212|nr:CopG family transcriptional regulator [Staphylococcus agnetis]MCO4327877.1 CopG family transcriptional regulator [Staphylococcus agnetis]